MSYLVAVNFYREFGDDLLVVCDKKEYLDLPLKTALEKQFAAEIQVGFDESNGATAGMFTVQETFNFDIGKDATETGLTVTDTVRAWREWLITTGWKPNKKKNFFCTVGYYDDNNNFTALGTTVIRAGSKKDANQAAMDKLWDNRLDGVDVLAAVKIRAATPAEVKEHLSEDDDDDE